MWRLHKTVELQRRIEKLTTSQLKRLDSWLHQLIADRETEIEEQHHKGREVLARVVKPGGTMQLEMVRCGEDPRDLAVLCNLC